MKKIIIIGPSGTGKTTLARALSAKLGIPHYELDGFYHQRHWQPADKEQFRARVFKIAEADAWIFCGNYFSILGLDFWKKADTVIWCNFPFLVVFSQLLRRTFRRAITKEALWNGNTESLRNSLFSKQSVIYWMLTSWGRQNARHAALFARPQDVTGVRLVRLRNRRAAQRFVDTIAS